MRFTTIPHEQKLSQIIYNHQTYPNLKHDQKVQRIQQLKTTLNHEEGPKILRNLGRLVADATRRQHLFMNLDHFLINSSHSALKMHQLYFLE